MSVVNITNVTILEPQGHFLDPYKFEITFECLSQLDDDLEFKLVYVGSAENTTLDQELDSLLVGPVPVGVNKFVFEADAPQVNRLPKEDIIGVTVILLTCSYKTKEFVRIGYYVDNAYNDEELQQNPPEVPVLERVFRNILADKPRVTRFPINWDDPNREEQPPAQPEIKEEEERAMDDGRHDVVDEGGEEDDEEDEEDDDDKDEVDLEMLEEQDEGEALDDEEDMGDDEGEEMEDVHVGQSSSMLPPGDAMETD